MGISNDNGCPTGNGNQSLLVFAAQQGQTYRIAVAGYPGSDTFRLAARAVP